MSERSLNPITIISTELPKWWKELRERGDATGSVSLPDVVDFLIPQTPADVLLTLAGGPVGAAARKLLIGGAGAAYAGYTEAASGAVKAGTKIAQKVKAAVLRGKSQKYSGDALKELQPIFRERYPEVGEPVLMRDPKTGKEFLSKGTTPESELLMLARKEAQKRIDAGDYEPYFKLEERYYVDPNLFPLEGRTIVDAMPKKPETIEKYRKQFDTPEVRARLLRAYDAAKDDPLASRWYAMGQLLDEYIKVYGKTEGLKKFKTKFADAMAATTGGSDPTSNFLMAQYANFLRERGLRVPEVAYEMPSPIGGRYASANAQLYNRIINDETGLVASKTPKRFNFSANFLGHRDRGTIDEQMMTLFDPSKRLLAPPGDSYGVFESAVGKASALRDKPIADFQEVAWAGAKGTRGKPMIQHVNEAIARTSMITGMTPEEVVRWSIVLSKRPTYGIGAAGVGLGAAGIEE